MRGWLNRIFGDAGERAAVRYLKRSGYRIICRNFENRFGEIDIIAFDANTLVFIEVKTRRTMQRGTPVEAVDSRKQQQILKTAQSYLKQRQLYYTSVRYDIIGVLWPDNETEPEITHLRAAFPE